MTKKCNNIESVVGIDGSRVAPNVTTTNMPLATVCALCQPAFRHILYICICLLVPLTATAQIGEHRNDFSVGVGGGYISSTVGFNPSIPQSRLGSVVGGLSVRYVCEKYFSTVCSIYGEVNLAQVGWKEKILTQTDQPVINEYTGVAEEFQRTLTYLQVPLFARLGWGRERKGFQVFFQAGPQIGFLLGDKAKSNFDFALRNQTERVESQQEAPQDSLDIEKKFDYGIVAGIGLEYSHPKLGHFIIEGRYYYGLGDIFGNSKSDYFGRSNNNSIVVKLTYLFDITKTKNTKIK